LSYRKRAFWIQDHAITLQFEAVCNGLQRSETFPSLVENPRVAGSIPALGTIFFRDDMELLETAAAEPRIQKEFNI
jgi:hypothetical protein